MGKDLYKLVYLDNVSHPVAVSVCAYEQITEIVTASMLCTGCYRAYTAERPQVAENVCLVCFLAKRTNDPTDLRFAGEIPSEYAARYGYKVFKFIDAQGYVYLLNSHMKFNERHSRDLSATLLHYGYRLPERYTLKDGSEVDLQDYSWRSIVGDFRSSPVVLATYTENYGNHIQTAFLLFRDLNPLEFSKRKNPVRQWYLDTKAEIEATFQLHKGYLIGLDVDGEPHTAYQLYDSHMYPGIVARAVASYNKTHGL